MITAEEFLNKYKFEAGEAIGNKDFDTMALYAREFAKLHVEAALKAALEDSPHGSSTDIPSYEDMKDAILNAYPLDLIK